MTANQLEFWKLKETERSNAARETETNRSNLAQERETQRHNTTSENLAQAQLDLAALEAAGKAVDTIWQRMVVDPAKYAPWKFIFG